MPQFIEVYPFKTNNSISLLNVSLIKMLHVKLLNESIKDNSNKIYGLEKWFIVAELKGGEQYLLIPCYDNEDDAISEALNIFPLMHVEEAED